jgi:hypothetical protein
MSLSSVAVPSAIAILIASSRVELVLYAVNHGDPLPAEWLAGVSQTTPAA